MLKAEDFVESFMQRGFVVAVSPQLSCWRMPSTRLHGSLVGGRERALHLSPHALPAAAEILGKAEDG